MGDDGRCAVCGLGLVRALGRCGPCYAYRRRTGRDRSEADTLRANGRRLEAELGAGAEVYGLRLLYQRARARAAERDRIEGLTRNP